MAMYDLNLWRIIVHFLAINVILYSPDSLTSCILYDDCDCLHWSPLEELVPLF